MNCEKSRELFVDYIGEELSKPDASELRIHLRSCPGCQQELALLARTKATLQAGWPEEAIPQSLSFDFAGSHSGGFWSQLWNFRMPKGVTVSLTVTACFVICLVGLALARIQILIENGALKVSFGQPQLPATYAVEPSGTASLQTTASQAGIQRLIDEALHRFEQNQGGKLRQALAEATAELESKREADLRRIAGEFKYLERIQSEMWKDAVRNSSYLQALVRDFHMKTDAAGSVQ